MTPLYGSILPEPKMSYKLYQTEQYRQCLFPMRIILLKYWTRLSTVFLQAGQITPCNELGKQGKYVGIKT